MEPKYDEDTVNLGYLNKAIKNAEQNINKEYENVSRHYASKPQPPYYKGDTWIDGYTVYTCINTRVIGTYTDSDWTTESGAKAEAEDKNKIYLTQPTNYKIGDMWILQTDDDHKAGKKGEILITTVTRNNYNENDWVNMLSYGTIKSINEVSNNLNEAIERIGVIEDAVEDGIIITYYQNTVPEAKHIGDLWYVTDNVENYVKGKLYRYDGEIWQLLDDPAITEAFEEANEARLIADGKIQSFYSETEPTENMGVGDLWIDTANDNKLHRYNGTTWVAVYDTRVDQVVENVDMVIQRTIDISTDLGVINQKVADTEKRIDEDVITSMTELTQSQEDLKFSINKMSGNNLIRNSAMINGFNFWVQELENADDSEYQNLLNNTSSSEYWGDGSSALENTMSGRVIKLDGGSNFAVSHVFNAPEAIILNKNEEYLALSCVIKNTSQMGTISIGVMFSDLEKLEKIEDLYSVYEYGIVITPDDMKTASRIEIPIKIPKKEEFIEVVASGTVPTDIQKIWLDTTVYMPKKYNEETETWELFETQMSCYDETTRKVWTYRKVYGFYYETPVNFDEMEIKSCFPTFEFYPSFCVFTGNTEPTPKKGLYWNNTNTDIVKRAKYNGTEFVEWETTPISSSLLPTGASMGVQQVDYIVPIMGFYEVADVKLEYNTIATKWTSYQGEIYSKNFKADERGFSIQSGENEMLIDENEILATWRGANIFFINQDMAFFKRLEVEEEVKIAEYTLARKVINSKAHLVLY